MAVRVLAAGWRCGVTEMKLCDARHHNRSAAADPLIWCQWLAMDLGAVAMDEDSRELMLAECHLPGKFLDRKVRFDNTTQRYEPVGEGGVA